MASAAQIQYIAQQAQARGLDPNAVLAIAGHEGLSGAIGDGGHAFGPFQMNNAGGVLTGKLAGMTPQQENAWAWSPTGINTALNEMAPVAKGLKGNAAITAIATKYERPANPTAEIADAESRYGTTPTTAQPRQSVVPSGPKTASSTNPALINAGGSAARQALVASLFNPQQFSSSQVSTPNLVALAQLRQINSTGTGSVPHASTQVAAAAVSGGSNTGQSVAKTALSQLGEPYQYGGAAKLGSPTDCSGLLQASLAAHGISIPRTTYQQWQTGKAVPVSKLQPGDAVFFRGSDPEGNLPGHVGIYIGNGKYVQDPHTGATVTISTLADAKDYVGARRYT